MKAINFNWVTQPPSSWGNGNIVKLSKFKVAEPFLICLLEKTI